MLLVRRRDGQPCSNVGFGEGEQAVGKREAPSASCAASTTHFAFYLEDGLQRIMDR